MLPAEAVEEQDHQRRENGEGEILRRLEHSRRQAPFMARKPHDGQAIVGRKRRGFSDTHQEAQHEQHQERRAEHVDVALQIGQRRPDNQAQPEHRAGAIPVENDAAGDLHAGVGPAEGGEGNAHGHRVETQIRTHCGGGNRQGGTVNVVEHRHDENHHEDEVADFRPHFRVGRDHFYFPYCDVSYAARRTFHGTSAA